MFDPIQNGRITNADIMFSRGFILDCWLTIEFDGSGQGFGGYALGGNPFDKPDVQVSRHAEQRNLAADFIGGIMAVADVEKFSELKGRVIRVRRDEPFGPIVAIGHPLKDLWYCPSERLAALAKVGGE